MTGARHWAAAYIARPWRSGAHGPDAYYCWGLVQALCIRRHGVQMPAMGDGDNQAAILEAVRAIGWERVETPAADDIVLARRTDGARHCGYLVEADGVLGVLHANGYQSARGPVGSVVFQTIEEFASGGYHQYEFWRRRA